MPVEREDVPESLRPILFEPESRLNLNPGKPFYLTIRFNLPLEETDFSNFYDYVTLVSPSREIVQPRKVSLDEETKDKLRIAFGKNSLSPGTCYELALDETKLGVAVAKEEAVHTYCTIECKCNPYANAVCTEM
jgi:hypothetical protein